MKVIAYSFWEKPEVIAVKSRKQAKRVAREFSDQQKKVEILTEKEFKQNN